MAVKGQIDASIDVGALNEVIVFANSYRQDVITAADTIRKLCQNMLEEESLKGGRGEVIREQFAAIATGCQKLEKSTEHIVRVLNDKLKPAIEALKAGSAANSGESMSNATKKTGVYNKE